MAFGTVNVPGVTVKELKDVSDIANDAKTAADSVQGIATGAQSTADAALEAANAARGVADNASTTAEAALGKATANEAAIGQVSQTANTAISTANAASTAAAEAKTAAQNAQQAAQDAAQAVTDLTSTINTIPTQNGSLYYTGAAQSPSWNGLDTSKVTLGGTTTGTNVGTYNATVTPKEGFKWPDGTTTAKTIQWTISRAIINVPTATAAQTYTGSELTAQWNGYDSSKMTIGGTFKATNVNTYNATFTPGANYQWPDGSTTAKTVAWSIAKAAGSLTLNKTSMALNAGTMSGAIGVTRAGDGAISASSSNTSVATVSVSGTTVTVTAKGKGSATITISVAAGTNHTAPSSKTCSVTVTLPTATLNDNDWDVIGQASSAGTAASWWSAGDTKSLTLNGTVGTLSLSNLTVNAFILGINHNASKEGSNRIHWAIGKISGTQIALCDGNYNNGYEDGRKAFNMNHWCNWNRGGWKGCDLRYDILGSTNKAPSGYGSAAQAGRVGYDPTNYDIVNSPVANTLMAAMPQAVRKVMKTVTKYTDNVGNASGDTAGNVTASVDYFFLLAEKEVYGGSRTYANSYEGGYQEQYDYFKAGNSKQVFRHDARTTAVWGPLRSPHCGIGYYFSALGSGGSVTGYGAYYCGGLLAGFST